MRDDFSKRDDQIWLKHTFCWLDDAWRRPARLQAGPSATALERCGDDASKETRILIGETRQVVLFSDAAPRGIVAAAMRL